MLITVQVTGTPHPTPLQKKKNLKEGRISALLECAKWCLGCISHQMNSQDKFS